MLLFGSPDCNIDKSFISPFHFPRKATKIKPLKHLYRNPIYLAREYKEMIDSEKTKNQAERARIKSISRARVTQILRLLKFDSYNIQELEKLGDPIKTRIITECMLRRYINKSSREQEIILNILNDHL